ncbi:hypothetical protein RR48_06938 [Papilio machaon]|uniref:THAP-type domain-containing protein n=1 Tax=Papilio machaon TaxID=76193 RepID=A0A194R8M5_PAPMA|nr:hypothetical protein RR48_06938 [Papilio machaon]
MDLRKCCLGNCSSTNRTHRLFYLPKDDNLRQLWLSFLIPTNIELSGLSKEQLLAKRVCQKHFDRYQFDNTGNRLRSGYPCLFTAKEIFYGSPLSSTVGDHISDHNYCLPIAPESDIKEATALRVDGDHSYHKSVESQVPEPIEIASTTKCSHVVSQILVEPAPETKEQVKPILVETTGDHSYHKSVESQVPEPIEIASTTKCSVVVEPAPETKEQVKPILVETTDTTTRQKHALKLTKKCHVNVDGTIEVSGQKLSVVFDPPHLLKGLRNNFLTKNMVFDGAIATWDDILTVYRADCQLGHTRMNKKLTDHHVIASKIKKMKVSVAAQVLSAQTSAMLKYTSLYSMYFILQI